MIGDGTDGALHQEHLPMPSHAPLPPSAASNTPRTRVYHPNTECSYPGGLNYLQQMDQDEYAHYREYNPDSAGTRRDECLVGDSCRQVLVDGDKDIGVVQE